MVTVSKRKITNHLKVPTEADIQPPCKRQRPSNGTTGEASNVSGDAVRPALKNPPEYQPDRKTGYFWINPSACVSSIEDFETKYVQQQELGSGAFGSVFAGYRTSDNLPIIHNEKYRIPLEVAIMQQLAGRPESIGKSTAVTLIDWCTLEDQLILVIERPEPCQTLMAYAKKPLSEHQAKNIMRQLVTASIEMISMLVCHNDIKVENILVELRSNVPHVRLIDFGCSCFLKETHFTSDARTDYHHMNIEMGELETVFQLGNVLHDILTPQPLSYSFSLLPHKRRNKLNNVTQECQDFMNKCVNPSYESRAALQDLQQHPWICGK
ncbi:serine/threonine-protein kinase pim-1-like [Antennarius striatus]|uniref:serine/threonine-protein kinase pim-1-like n=1 Tax=Antennarius striatus TaxID=241820 RepID=UPI0035B495EB